MDKQMWQAIVNQLTVLIFENPRHKLTPERKKMLKHAQERLEEGGEYAS